MGEALGQISSTALQKQSTCKKCNKTFFLVGEDNGYGFITYPSGFFCEECKSIKLEKTIQCKKCSVGIAVPGYLSPFGDSFESYPEKDYCDKCQIIIDEELRKDKIEHKLQALSQQLSSFGLPPKLTSIEFPLSQQLKQFIPLIRIEGIIGFRGLCLSGPSGVGKTFSIAMIIRDWTIEAIKREEYIRDSWVFVNYPSFIMKVQDAYKKSKGDDTPLAMLDSLAHAKFLVIDDLGVEKATEYVKQATYYILNEREMNLRPTYITTNFTLNQLNDFIDPRISSRIVGMCEIKEVKGTDRRIPIKK